MAAPDQFRAACGDRYLAAIVTGSAFSALITLDEDNTTREDSLSRVINIAGKGQSASASDAEDLKSVTSNIRHSVVIMSSAVPGEIEPSFEGILKTSKGLRDYAHNSGVVVREIALPYPRPGGSNAESRQVNAIEGLADRAISVRKSLNGL